MKIRNIILLLVSLMGTTAALTWFWPHGADYYYDRGCEMLAGSRTDEHWLVKWDLKRALLNFNHAIELNRDFSAAYENRAAVKETTGDWKGALADYNRAIELNPRNSNNYKGRAGVKRACNDLDGAMADYARAVELNPNDRTLYMLRSRISESRGDLIGSLTDRARMGELAPPISSPLPANWGGGMRMAGDWGGGMRMGTNWGGGQRRDPARWSDRMLTRYDRALELNTNFSWGYYHRGIAKGSQNDPDGALADFRRCEELPDAGLRDYAAIHIWLVRTKQGETTEADQELAGYFGRRAVGATNDWPANIAGYLLNQINELKFFAAISPASKEWQLSQFWYYTGMKHLLAGERDKAADCFRKSLDTKTRPYAVFISARIELASLSAATNADSNP